MGEVPMGGGMGVEWVGYAVADQGVVGIRSSITVSAGEVGALALVRVGVCQMRSAGLGGWEQEEARKAWRVTRATTQHVPPLCLDAIDGHTNLLRWRLAFSLKCTS